MRRQQQIGMLLILVLCVIGVQIVAHRWQPTIGGLLLQQAELSKPLAELRPTEYAPLLAWLRVDSILAVLYAVLFTWGLRRAAAALPPGRLNMLGRALSWVTAAAVLFPLAEHVILWVGATIGAPHVSPWLAVLVKLDWLSASVFAAYMILFAMRKLARRGSALGA